MGPALSLCVVAVLSAACTYGPPEERIRIPQIVRLGDSYLALAIVQHEEVRRPTGLSAFPDGGKWRFLQRRAIAYVLDAESAEIHPLATIDAPDELWESFNAWVAGLEADSVAYLRLTGCPRGGDCHPALQRQRALRVSANGEAREVDVIPDSVELPGSMIARVPGEVHYVRFGTTADTITARLEEGGPHVPLFHIRPDGTAEVVRR